MKSTFVIPTLFFTVVLLSTGCDTQQPDEKQSLKGDWKFILGDDMRFANPKYDDSDWEDIQVPSAWEDEGFRNYDGYAWYRKTFKLDFKKLIDPLFLHLGNIDDADEVFFNGTKIGSTGSFPPEFLTAYNLNRTYPIPVELINKSGENVIAVRVYDVQLDGGILGWNVGIYNYGRSDDEVIQLMGRWKFQPSDNLDWSAKEFDDTSWEDIMVPTNWESQGFGRYDGVAWYRKTFELPAGFSTSNQILILGKIDDIDVAYINGIEVGNTGDFDKGIDGDEYNKVRTYFIADNILKPDAENVIAVRVKDVGAEGGIYKGPVVILDAKNYKDFWNDYHSGDYNFHRWFWRYVEE